MTRIAHTGAALFDGTALHSGQALITEDGIVVGIGAPGPGDTVRPLPGGTLLPGFVDLQVNGGGGVMFNDAPTVATLATMARAHADLGTRALLPTLITDTPAMTAAAIDAVAAAMAQGIPGIVGIHLEGPHLSVARKGAHDPALIRPMADTDLALLCAAARRIPHLMVTVAPESVTPEQIADLTGAGILVSLGHSDCGLDAARAAFAAGAVCVTHLFNAMSQLGNREPGLVGAALEAGAVSAGLIADGIHVHPASIRAALRAKQGPGRVFLVTDAMATAGSDIDGFTLNGRWIRRHDGRLTLQDGTLAGADLDFATAIGVLCGPVGLDRAAALAMATSVPADLLGAGGGLGRFVPGQPARAIHLAEDGTVTAA
jgi:N-acetylglucosamine-6-phosphate deacetylase